MPVVKMPDGTNVSFPDDMPNDQIKGMIASKFPEAVPQQAATQSMPQSTALQTAGDVVASGASGAVRGTADLLGTPGTIGDALNSGMGWALKKGYQAVTGSDPSPGSFFAGSAIPSSVVGGDAMRGYASAATNGASDYQPKTTAGEYARTLGEFAPAAALGGLNPANMLRGAVLPAAASEGAGQATEGTALEPYARVAGAILGGGIGQATASAPKIAGQTAKDVLNEGGELYQAAKPVMQNTQINNQTFRKIATDLAAEAKDFGLVPGEHDALGGIINRALASAKTGTPSLQDVEILRRQLMNAGKNISNPSAAELSGRLVGKLDDAVETLGTGQIIGNAQDATQALDQIKEARQLWRTGRKSELIENAIEAGKNAASGPENGLRVEFRKLLNNKKLARNFSAEERAAIKTVANGNLASNAARLAGTFGVSLDGGRNGLGAFLGGAGGMAAGGPAGALATAAVGTGARSLARKMTGEAANVVDQMVKAGPNAQAVFNQLTRQAGTANKTAILKAYVQSLSAAQVPSGIPSR